MDTIQLEKLLESMGVPKDAYSIGSEKNESYGLLSAEDRWFVFYSERGVRTNETVFTSEGAACRALLDRLLSDGVIARYTEHDAPDLSQEES